MRSYFTYNFLKKISSYYFIDLCQILNRSKLGPAKLLIYRVLIYRVLIYRVLIYRGSTVYAK